MSQQNTKQQQAGNPESTTGDETTKRSTFSFGHFSAVLLARNREFLRDRSSWAWNIIFPIMLIAGLAVLFGNDDRALYKIGVYPSADESLPFFTLRHLGFVDIDSLASGVQSVERHQLDMLVNVSERQYWINETSPNGYITERILLGSESGQFGKQLVSGKEVRYVDWVVPGVLGMNMMFTCLFGVGYVIVRYRKSGVLKRLKATPLGALEFLTAQVVSRLWLVLAITWVVFLGTDFFLDFTMHGSYVSLAVVLLIGAFSLITMGLLVAAQTASEELAGGLLNLFTWPMMMLSGVWFSLEGAHPLIKVFAQTLPLTHVVQSARSVMIDGAGLAQVALSLIYLACFSAACLALGAWLFRWE